MSNQLNYVQLGIIALIVCVVKKFNYFDKDKLFEEIATM